VTPGGEGGRRWASGRMMPVEAFRRPSATGMSCADAATAHASNRNLRPIGQALVSTQRALQLVQRFARKDLHSSRRWRAAAPLELPPPSAALRRLAL